MPTFDTQGARIAYDVAGEGPPVLMIHGFPQTREMWAPIVPSLAAAHTVVTADLRGYGASMRPEGGVETMTFRAMGADMAALMEHLGHERFDLVGHDRGARVAYRLARDNAQSVKSLTLMDIAPTDWLIDNWDYRIARSYYHWTFLAQPAPLPERLIGADPDAFFESCLLGWGGATMDDFPAAVTYRAAWRRPEVIAAMVDDYRAAVDIDIKHDADDAGIVLDMPTLILWGESGVMGCFYDMRTLWRDRFSHVEAQPITGGHFFVDQSPDETAATLERFLARLR